MHYFESLQQEWFVQVALHLGSLARPLGRVSGARSLRVENMYGILKQNFWFWFFFVLTSSWILPDLMAPIFVVLQAFFVKSALFSSNEHG